MVDEEKTKASGARLLRSETVGVRLDPRLRYLAELAARHQRRTLSSFIEWCIEEALVNLDLERADRAREDIDEDIAPNWQGLWDVDEADRFLKLCRRNPELLNYEEQVRWKLIQECGLFWRGDYVGEELEWKWNPATDEPDKYAIRKHWDTICAISAGKRSSAELPQWAPFRPRWVEKSENKQLYHRRAIPAAADPDMVPGESTLTAKARVSPKRKSKQ